MVQCLKYNLNSFIGTSCFLEGEINKLNLLLSNTHDCMLVYTHTLPLTEPLPIIHLLYYIWNLFIGMFSCAQKKNFHTWPKHFSQCIRVRKFQQNISFLNIICCSLPPHTKAVSLRADPGFPCVFLSEPLSLFLNVISNFLASSDWKNCFFTREPQHHTRMGLREVNFVLHIVPVNSFLQYLSPFPFSPYSSLCDSY